VPARRCFNRRVYHEIGWRANERTPRRFLPFFFLYPGKTIALYSSQLACSSCPLAVRSFHYLNFWDPGSPKNCSGTKSKTSPLNTMGGNSERLLCFTDFLPLSRRTRHCLNRQQTPSRSEPRTVFFASTQARGEPPAGFVR
jgi:hypothetical protein